jgi:aryl-alcohol dehydrogenase-like predicted oxidoreductase
MMQYSLLDRRPEESSGLLQEHQISVLTRGSYGQGLLLGKPAKEYLGHGTEEVSKAATAVREVAGAGRTAAEVAVRYVLAQPVVASAVLGMRTDEQLKEAIWVGKAPALTLEELEQLRHAVPPLVYEQHR